ncbi:seipin co-factor family protein [Aspergillus ruber CBS 135680]|uniref:Uncharacterized protein n=1 Tax=Aspergillus ruber (strain CBS 135680) TaxID=1388766 RepID=A0A017S8K0_ASPRC|nr:uncharacterized protein EURHEDRAFT_414683 [Aspergillus ruber CBS 135680]EYE93106.1 hypothetical protein EURHEDRAFT_414683 [Aspergillus ruber CBS 135680]
MAISLENGYTATAPQFKPESLPPKQQQPNTKLSKTEYLHRLFQTYINPPATAALKSLQKHFNTHPLLTTFLTAQFLTSILPILLFTTGVLTAGLVAAGIFAFLGLLVLGPVLVITGILGVVVWGWGWGVVFVGRWVWGGYVGRHGNGAGGSGNIKRENGTLKVTM